MSGLTLLLAAVSNDLFYLVDNCKYWLLKEKITPQLDLSLCLQVSWYLFKEKVSTVV